MEATTAGKECCSAEDSLDSDADWCRPASASSRAPAEAVCGLVRAEWFENRYSGLFQKADYGLARLSMMQSGQSAGGWRQFVPTSFLGFERDTEQPPSPALALWAEISASFAWLRLKFFRGGQVDIGIRAF
ncbi:hypothetical protein AK812_SmicGene45445 [Symbiodinium microadriaticum]|uniref:Uncharacterized protein n=1 Tax=Symbiodinium microadriaticum TaxID=2951 RepID=A0A1Q9BW22_SYMMI|nr:hypothetical protein AK812_SmicGene45445 [Symbiodinium microadriaticum]